jgi:hypothetical protein
VSNSSKMWPRGLLYCPDGMRCRAKSCTGRTRGGEQEDFIEIQPIATHTPRQGSATANVPLTKRTRAHRAGKLLHALDAWAVVGLPIGIEECCVRNLLILLWPRHTTSTHLGGELGTTRHRCLHKQPATTQTGTSGVSCPTVHVGKSILPLAVSAAQLLHLEVARRQRQLSKRRGSCTGPCREAVAVGAQGCITTVSSRAHLRPLCDCWMRRGLLHGQEAATVCIVRLCALQR